jgi:hypothetical protein
MIGGSAAAVMPAAAVTAHAAYRFILVRVAMIAITVTMRRHRSSGPVARGARRSPLEMLPDMPSAVEGVGARNPDASAEG